MVDRDATSIHEEFGGERLPSGQRRTERFPVLSKSGTPSWDMETWEFTVTGAVENDLAYTWEEFTDLPQETQLQDFHCVTGWSRFDNEFTGVTFPTPSASTRDRFATTPSSSCSAHWTATRRISP